ncbi:MAG: hypothetical protein GEV28_10605 [Actinophytocola sp.]|uniref:hypothetical protein n=1 Tax=Actinophytocola sp. TaxID=1872138 RepID=UPI001326D0BB|nr:hypothetical protein [Actinophytocola sp.]MPZ80814.1 hypothetical protein [Actinophytocola sp.]
MAISGTTRKLGGFGLALAVAFAAAYGVGQAVGPVAAEPEPAAAEHEGMGGADGAEDGMADMGGHGDAHGGEPAGVPKGLMVSADGVTLDVLSDGLRAGVATDFAFRILDDHGSPVTAFAPTHDKLMHLVVARRDLSGFQHVHPTMAADGTWRIPLTVASAGDYRVFADFLPRGREEGVTLGADVPVSGAYQPKPLPAPALAADVDGYRVTLAGALVPGTTSKLTLSVDKGGVPVTDLQPYLAAYGHLIALRQGDLAYLHVHPDGEPGDGKTPAGPSITFYAEVPTAGTYRLYLDFKHGGVVRTAELTAVATPNESESHESEPHGEK